MSPIEPRTLEEFQNCDQIESGQVVPQGMTDAEAARVVPLTAANAGSDPIPGMCPMRVMADAIGDRHYEPHDGASHGVVDSGSLKWKPRLLQECVDVITGDRNRDYGDPWENHERTAEIFRWWIKSRFGVDVAINALDICMFNDLQKSSRLANSIDHWDSWKDKAGYCGNAGVILDHNAGK